RNARHEIDLARERAAASLARLGADAAKVSAELAGRETEVAAAENDHRRLADAAAKAAASLGALEAELARLSADLEEAERRPRAWREARGELEPRGGALAEIAREHETTAGQVRSALSARGVAGGARLSERLRPRAGWEEAVDLLLGADAEALLVPGDAAD